LIRVIYLIGAMNHLNSMGKDFTRLLLSYHLGNRPTDVAKILIDKIITTWIKKLRIRYEH